MGDYKVVVLSGSMKFYDDILRVAQELSMAGNVVLMPFKDPRGSEGIPEEQKEIYDEQHRRKIMMADEMYVINKGGYIGKSTSSEITYALKVGKPVKFMEELKDVAVYDPVHKVCTIETPENVLHCDLGYRGVITICGSMKFWNTILNEQRKLTELGYLVYLPPVTSDKEKCGKIMNDRINASDMIYVVNEKGYTGDTTNENICYAFNTHKKILYYSPVISDKRVRSITLCGSGRFRKEIHDAYVTLTLQGYNVFTPAVFDICNIDSDIGSLTNEEHEVLDLVHRNKIWMTDLTLVINPLSGDGYFGENTKEEIEYARSIGKTVAYMTDPYMCPHITEKERGMDL